MRLRLAGDARSWGCCVRMRGSAATREKRELAMHPTDNAMCLSSQPLSLEEQKQLAVNITHILSLYGSIVDSYIIEFFTDNLWRKLPSSWQAVLSNLPSPQLAAVLLEKGKPEEVWYDVQLFAFGKEDDVFFTFSPLAAPFYLRDGHMSLVDEVICTAVVCSVVTNFAQQLRVVKKLSKIAKCDQVVDIGSGQGHLSRFLAFGLGLSVTAIEGDRHLVDMATKFDQELVWVLKKEQARRAKDPGQIFHGPSHVVGWVDPQAPWQEFLVLPQQETDTTCSPRAESRPSLESVATCNSPGPQKFTPPSAPLRGGRDRAETEKAGEKGPGGGCLVLATAKHEGSPDTLRNRGFTCVPAGHHPLHQPSQPRTGNPLAEGRVLLTGLHACGDLSVALLRHFTRCPHVVAMTSVACCYMKLTTQEDPTPPGLVAPPSPSTHWSKHGYPLSAWVASLPGHALSYKAREVACHALEDYVLRLRKESPVLRTHCYRAMLETLIRAADPAKRCLGVQTINKAHQLPFKEYARLGLQRVGLDANAPLDWARIDAMLAQQQNVVAFFSLALLLAPLVETLILLDRMIYLREQGFHCEVIPLFNPRFSPRNLVLVAAKTGLDSTLSMLVGED